VDSGSPPFTSKCSGAVPCAAKGILSGHHHLSPFVTVGFIFLQRLERAHGLRGGTNCDRWHPVGTQLPPITRFLQCQYFGFHCLCHLAASISILISYVTDTPYLLHNVSDFVPVLVALSCILTQLPYNLLISTVTSRKVT